MLTDAHCRNAKPREKLYPVNDYILGGLTQDKTMTSGSGQLFLPKFMRSSSASDEKTEVLLLLQVTKL